MLKDIVEVQPKQGHQLYLKFEDGVSGTVDVSELIEFSGIFEPLRNAEYFRSVQLNSEIGTIHWSNGADLDPDVLYAEVSGQPISIGLSSEQLA